MINNHYLHKLLVEGIRIKTSVNGESRTVTLYAIDFNNVNNNEFIATNQFTFEGRHERRPDVTLFINGLPLVTFEFKDISNPNVSIRDAYNQFETYKEEISDYIENFIIFETNGDSTVKILGAYHQYYMVNKAIKAAKRAIKSSEDKRIGVVWHTTGSGKSLSMVFFASIAARKLNNPTMLVINDRNDLDDQLFEKCNGQKFRWDCIFYDS